jgi:hypothetical protein
MSNEFHYLQWPSQNVMQVYFQGHIEGKGGGAIGYMLAATKTLPTTGMYPFIIAIQWLPPLLATGRVKQTVPDSN